jgi:hypothetical protein
MIVPPLGENAIIRVIIIAVCVWVECLSLSLAEPDLNIYIDNCIMAMNYYILFVPNPKMHYDSSRYQ